MRLELNAAIFKDANFLANVMVLGTHTALRRGSLLKNFIWKTNTTQTDNIKTDFREKTSEDINEGNTKEIRSGVGLSFIITDLN